jgi:hypothetical protein
MIASDFALICSAVIGSEGILNVSDKKLKTITEKAAQTSLEQTFQSEF